jgi:hypothetical protein
MVKTRNKSFLFRVLFFTVIAVFPNGSGSDANVSTTCGGGMKYKKISSG